MKREAMTVGPRQQGVERGRISEREGKR